MNANRKFEAIIDYLLKSESAILTAHDALGVPLEDLIDSAVRKALSVSAADASSQLRLVFERANRGKTDRA